MFILIFLLLLTLALWWHHNDKRRYSKFPPGPFRFPIIGNLPQLLLNQEYVPAKAFEKLSKIYGDVMFIKVGRSESVFFSSDTIHEMLTNEKAGARFQNEFVKDRHNHRNLGLIWSEGTTWQNLRRFTVRSLRDFGFGKSKTMDVIINEEIEKFHDNLKKDLESSSENILHVEDLFTMTVVNVLWALVTGKTFHLKDPKIERWMKLNRDFFKSLIIGMDLSDSYPFLRDWFPDWTWRTRQIEISKELYDYSKNLLDEQKRIGSSDISEPSSFIDVFTQKIEDSKNDSNTDFTDEQFIWVILDLILAGSDTSSNSLNFGILYMMLYPEVQKKVQEEIDALVPIGVPIDSSMKASLPYTCATILEIMRYSTVAPMPAPRVALEDFYFQDYLIKKGTSLIFNVYSLHFNEKLWGDPMNFRPERFLNTEGTAVNQKLADRLKTYGAGKRYCLGQSLAEITIFQYFASTLRKFEFAKVPGTYPTLDPVMGLTLSPKPFAVRVTERCTV